tara:strand:+ start:182 stop:427 length:246 start_codon:yes stop_codon:yes gene_type:complete
MLAQDTTNVFIDLNIETKVIKVRPQETVCLHFVDGKNRQREVTTLFSDGSHTHTMWETKQKTICSPSNITEVLIGKPKEIK